MAFPLTWFLNPGSMNHGYKSTAAKSSQPPRDKQSHITHDDSGSTTNLDGLFLQGANIWDSPVVASGTAQFIKADSGWQADPLGKEESLHQAQCCGGHWNGMVPRDAENHPHRAGPVSPEAKYLLGEVGPTFSSQKSLLLSAGGCACLDPGSPVSWRWAQSCREPELTPLQCRWAAGPAWSRVISVTRHPKSLVDQGLQCECNMGMPLGLGRLLATFCEASVG